VHQPATTKISTRKLVGCPCFQTEAYFKKISLGWLDTFIIGENFDSPHLRIEDSHGRKYFTSIYAFPFRRINLTHTMNASFREAWCLFEKHTIDESFWTKVKPSVAGKTKIRTYAKRLISFKLYLKCVVSLGYRHIPNDHIYLSFVWEYVNLKICVMLSLIWLRFIF
jgi:hypothetical protein